MTIVALFATQLAAESPQLGNIECIERLDSLLARVDDSTSNTDSLLRDGFLTLETACPGVPQIAHNLAVMAVRNGDLAEAERHFERALEMDARLGDTWRQWRSLKRHRADRTLARALSSEHRPAMPEFRLQHSVVSNDSDSDSSTDTTDSDNKRLQLHHRQQTDQRIQIEYELYSLWQERGDVTARADYYTPSFPQSLRGRVIDTLATGTGWNELGRQIELLDDKAVVILSSGELHRALLLMERDGSRWKIRQELPL